MRSSSSQVATKFRSRSCLEVRAQEPRLDLPAPRHRRARANRAWAPVVRTLDVVSNL